MFSHAFSTPTYTTLTRSGSMISARVRNPLTGNPFETKGARSKAQEDKLSHIPLCWKEGEGENLDEMNGRLFETRLDDDAAPHGRVIKYLHCHRRSRRLIPELIVFHFIQRLRALPLYGVDKHGVVGSARTLFFLFFFFH